MAIMNPTDLRQVNIPYFLVKKQYVSKPKRTFAQKAFALAVETIGVFTLLFGMLLIGSLAAIGG